MGPLSLDGTGDWEAGLLANMGGDGGHEPRPHDSRISLQADPCPLSPPTVASKSASRPPMLSLKRTRALAGKPCDKASAEGDAGTPTEILTTAAETGDLPEPLLLFKLNPAPMTPESPSR